MHGRAWLALGQKKKTGSGAVVGVGFLSAPAARALAHPVHREAGWWWLVGVLVFGEPNAGVYGFCG